MEKNHNFGNELLVAHSSTVSQAIYLISDGSLALTTQHQTRLSMSKLATSPGL